MITKQPLGTPKDRIGDTPLYSEKQAKTTAIESFNFAHPPLALAPFSRVEARVHALSTEIEIDREKGLARLSLTGN